MTTQFFNSKKQLKEFKTAWKKATKDFRCKPKWKPCDEHVYLHNSPNGYGQWELTQRGYVHNEHGYSDYIRKGTGKYKVPGWLQSEHYMFYNIVRGLPYDRGFTTITNKKKLENGAYFGFIAAKYKLINIKHRAERIIRSVEKGELPWDYDVMHIREFLRPFPHHDSENHLFISIYKLANLEINA